MMTRWQLWMILVSGIVLSGFLVAENFVVNKKKPQKQSMNKLKETYADQLAELIRIIPGLQKQLADIQERLIHELYSLLNDEMQVSKIELNSRICKAQDLRCCLEHEANQTLPIKSAFAKQLPVPEKSKVVV